jgi:hypothetical protein
MKLLPHIDSVLLTEDTQGFFNFVCTNGDVAVKLRDFSLEDVSDVEGYRLNLLNRHRLNHFLYS